MKSLERVTSQLSKLLLMTLFLVLAPAALASNTWYVDGVNGNDNNDCKTTQTACKTIGHAISLCSRRDTIMVGPATYTENLTIRVSLKIIGSDAATTIVDGGGVGTVFNIPNNSYKTQVVLSKLTIKNGSGTNGGGIYIDSVDGTLTINKSTVTANSASAYGGGIYSGDGPLTINNSTIRGNSAYGGGGIFAFAGLTINSSTIRGNVAYGVDGISGGGGIEAPEATATINNSTISGNRAKHGGGIEGFEGELTINNSTISGNSARTGGGIVSGVSPVTLQNSIVANNPGGNCSGTITSNGYNLSSDSTCNFNGAGDMNNTKAKLGGLGYHGGPTQTIPLLEGSPAIDAGNPNGCTDGNGNLLKTDQRGKPRPDKEDTSGCDIGAYERQSD